MTTNAWNFKDRTGVRYGKLTCKSMFKNPGHPKLIFWLCQCDCGNWKSVSSGALCSGHTLSCGCLHSEVTKKKFTTHGETNKNSTKEYRAWCSMKRRCYYSKEKLFHRYGGRGITVCERWRNSYENFLSDMGRAEPNMTLERKNTDGNYEPSNCCWASMSVQANNKSNNRKLTLNGRTMNLYQWAKETGLKPKRIWFRLKSGWSVERTLTTPPNPKFLSKKFNGNKREILSQVEC